MILTTWILSIRRPDQFSHPQFWAEDGSVFYEMAKSFGMEALFAPYAGYFHTYQRFVAQISSLLPAVFAPEIFLIATIFMVWFVIWLIYRPELKIKYKFFIVLMMSLIPHDGEVLVQLLNVQFFMAVGGLCLLLMDEPKSRLTKWIIRFSVILFSFTGPFMIMWLPISVLYHSVAKWNRNTMIRHLGPAVAILFIVIASSNSDNAFGLKSGRLADFSDYVIFLGRRTFGELLIESRVIGNFNHWISTALLVLFSIYILVVSFRAKNLLPFIFLAAGLAPLLAAEIKHRYDVGFILRSTYDRYTFVSSVFITTSFFQTVNRKKHWTFILALLFFINAARISYTSNLFVMDRPDLKWRNSADCFDHNETCKVHIHPEAWEVVKPGRWHY